MRNDNNASKYLTGLPWNIFDILCRSLTPHMVPPRKNLPLRNQIMMVLVRLQACESRSAFGIADLTADLQGPEFGKNMPTKFFSQNSSSL